MIFLYDKSSYGYGYGYGNTYGYGYYLKIMTNTEKTMVEKKFNYKI